MRPELACAGNSREGPSVELHRALVANPTNRTKTLLLVSGNQREGRVTGHDRQKWVELYKTAVFELEQSFMAGRIADARAEIVKRVEALRQLPGLHKTEQRAIEDALNNLRFLEREDAQITEQRRKAEVALEQLHLLEPTIERLQNQG